MRYLIFALLFPIALSGQIYHVDPCPPGGGVTYDVDAFTSSGTWTKPANLDYIIVVVQSGGSGGKAGRRGADSSNRGGGVGINGGCVVLKYTEAQLGSTEPVTVGAGGAGAAAVTTDNTNSANAGNGGTSLFRSSTNGVSVSGGSGANGGTNSLVSVIAQGLNFAWGASALRSAMLFSWAHRASFGTTGMNESGRGFTGADNSTYGISTSGGCGGQINSANTRLAAGTVAGYYHLSTGTLTNEYTGAAAETAATAPANGHTFGDVLNRIFDWFDPADAPYLCPRAGAGGGCGDTAGTIAGLAGTNGVGYGAGGGGGGASTNSANSGAGGNGTGGIVIVINVYL